MVALMLGADDDELIAAHCAHITYRGLRPSTIRQREWMLRRLRTWIDPHPLLAPPRELVEAFITRPSMGPEAQNNALTHVRGFYHWALRSRLVEQDPTFDLDRPRRKKRLPRPMPEDDLGRAITLAPEPIRTWIFLGAFGGLRCCEIAPIRGEHYDGETLFIPEQKGGDEGSIPVAPVLADVLDAMPTRGIWFPRWDDKSGPITPNQLQRHANRFLHSIGIRHTMHTLRHRFITRAHEAGAYDAFLTQQLARHATPATTAPYTEIPMVRMRAAVANLPVPA